MRRSLYFTAPREVSVLKEEVPPPRNGELAVKATCSAISGGTEMLMFRADVDPGTKLDDTISSLQGPCTHPFKYGYSTVGTVTAVGPGVSCDWVGKSIFSFHCHEESFNVPVSEVEPVPPGIREEDAVMLPSMETAVSITMDSTPLIGENVIILGQGVIGLLTTALFSKFPLGRLITADRFELRRRTSTQMGADISLDPSQSPHAFLEDAGLSGQKADLVVELSGRLGALELATHLAGMEGKIVVGSRYGSKAVPICLGDDFHRNRQRIISSQVSRVDGSLSGLWTKQRRLKTAWRLIRSDRPSRLVTHRFNISDAAEAYRFLDEKGENAIQVLLTYEEV
jgi:threonine dehydrogenase-like Zn-dependent dehydrogenase